jgi:hypothetical protein
MDEFELEKAELSYVTIRHASERHRHTFLIAVTEDGGRAFSDIVVMRENRQAKNRGKQYAAQSRAFAEREARAAGLIDSPIPLLTPTERFTLEMIQDLHHLPPERVEWALGKGYAELVGRQTRLRLTEAGLEALKSDADQRMEMRAANRPRRR